MKFSTTLFLAATSAVSAADCPAPGQTNAAGDYSCNPAHDYPGQACALIDGCYFLRGLGVVTGTAIKPTTEPTTKPTSSCPAPGQTNAAGDYSCNPAHEYPDQACALIDGCYFLRGLGVVTGTAIKPTTEPTTKPTSSCPAPGQTNAAGDYSCNPAHEYPDQACALIDGCYFLRGLGLVASTTTSSPTKPTSSCPAPGQTNAAGDYSCNPAHDYPGQACALIDGCYFLRGLGLETGYPVPTPVIVNGAAQLSALGGSVLAGLIACLL